MAKLLILLLLVATAVAAVLSAPTEGEYSLYPEDYGSQLEPGKIRSRRDECAIFNAGFGTPACMAYCYSTKGTAGYCNNDECACD